MKPSEKFSIIVLGSSGGPLESNLSSYLISIGGSDFLAFDSGTLLHGIQMALDKGSFAPFGLEKISAEKILQEHVKGYLISHAHFDHIAGLVICSQIDRPKKIYATGKTIGYLKESVFNTKSWPNYTNEGEHPRLNIYTYHALDLEKKAVLSELNCSVTPFSLSHPKKGDSTAFLLEKGGGYLLLCGDTCSDRLSDEPCLDKIWHHIAPLIDQRLMAGIFLECSYPSLDNERQAFGHLDTRMMMEELKKLATFCQNPLKGLKVVVTHRKGRASDHAFQLIEKELKSSNPLELDLIFCVQGDHFTL